MTTDTTDTTTTTVTGQPRKQPRPGRALILYFLIIAVLFAAAFAAGRWW